VENKEMNIQSNARRVADQLQPFTKDPQLTTRVYVNLTDMLESCLWFSEQMRANDRSNLTRDELETFLIHIDIKLLQHLASHLESFRKDMPALLNAVGVPED
jgi:hypothetical protein